MWLGLARAVRARSQEGVVGLDSDIWAGRMGDGEGMKCNGFFIWDLIWRQITLRHGFNQEVLKFLRKTTCWAWFDHEVLIVLDEQVWN